jgi:hypothetical protein
VERLLPIEKHQLDSRLRCLLLVEAVAQDGLAGSYPLLASAEERGHGFCQREEHGAGSGGIGGADELGWVSEDS